MARLDARMRAIRRALVSVALIPICVATAGRRMIDANASPVPTAIAPGEGLRDLRMAFFDGTDLWV